MREPTVRWGVLVAIPVLCLVAGLLGNAQAEDEKKAPAALTDVELGVLASEIESGLAKLEPAALRFDIDRAFERSTADLTDEIEASKLRLFMVGMRKAPALGNAIVKALRAGGAYEFRGIKDTPEGRALIFRLRHGGDGGVNFHELLVEKTDGGEAVVSDVFIYMSGEWFSQTIRRQILDFHASENIGLVARLLGKGDADFARSIKQQRALSRAVRSGRAKEALEIYAGLPKSVQSRKLMLILRMQAAQGLGDDAQYAAALKAFEQAHPEDPAWLLLSVDAYSMRGEPEKALGSIEKLLALVGDDGYLRFLVGSLWLQAGKVDEARKALEKAIDVEPELEDPYYGLVDVELTARDWPATARALSRCEKKLGVEFPALDKQEGFEEFVKSEAYAKWKKR